MRILQRERGYRFSLDALLLADFASGTPAVHALDLCSGSGVVAMVLAATGAAVRVTALELQAPLADLARRTILLNAFAERVEIVQGDLREPEILPRDAFDLVVCNPPFRPLGQSPPSPNRERAIARHEVCATLLDVVRSTKRVLRSGGRACFIYPADRLAQVCATMAHNGLWPRRLRLVHPRIDATAELCLIEARKEEGAALEVLPPLLVHEQDSSYTPALRNLLRLQ